MGGRCELHLDGWARVAVLVHGRGTGIVQLAKLAGISPHTVRARISLYEALRRPARPYDQGT
jgi:hypothetical protein